MKYVVASMAAGITVVVLQPMQRQSGISVIRLRLVPRGPRSVLVADCRVPISDHAADYRKSLAFPKKGVTGLGRQVNCCLLAIPICKAPDHKAGKRLPHASCPPALTPTNNLKGKLSHVARARNSITRHPNSSLPRHSIDTVSPQHALPQPGFAQ